jgi:hypothetical protein
MFITLPETSVKCGNLENRNCKSLWHGLSRDSKRWALKCAYLSGGDHEAEGLRQDRKVECQHFTFLSEDQNNQDISEDT